MKLRLTYFLLVVLFLTGCKTLGQNRYLILNEAQALEIKKNGSKAPLFKQTLEKIQKEVDLEISTGSDVPIPKDLAGGYTHERHRKNYLMMEQAGSLYRITGNKKYANYVKEMLYKYAAMFLTLPLHPSTKSYSRGKLFWQCLNDANWLVSVSQAYGNIYSTLNKVERREIEAQLLKPYADFLSIENPQFFNRIHNHSTWACAAVGMAGLAMGDEDLVNKALYGFKSDAVKADDYDNDGALILSDKMGFLSQIEGLFSPDGLYSEGPYYHRYAIYPFLVFAVSLENLKPELEIFKYRDGLLLKSVDALLAQSNQKGDFFPINDAQKGMSLNNPSLISAVDIAYYYGKRDAGLLSIAYSQNEVVLDATGLAVALDMKSKQPLTKKSIMFKDGANGELGGLAVLRNNDNQELLFKFGSQGMGHGHFDKLSYSFYNEGNEVVQDYGMARFVNIEQKGGGGYLKENTTFAKQTIAHNTLVINEISQYNGDTDTGEKYAPYLNFKDFSNPDIQIISAVDTNSYPGIHSTRTLLELDKKYFGNSLLIDVFQVKSETANQYDLPLYYQGQWIDTNFKYEVAKELNKLGNNFGYQHIWKEASATLGASNAQFTWLNNEHFYTTTSTNLSGDKIIMGRLGATDPSFNLRRDPVMITRRENTKNTTFLSLIEKHGFYSPIDEKALSPYSNIKSLKLLALNDDYQVIEIQSKDEKEGILIIANQNLNTKHKLEVQSVQYEWAGPYLFKLTENSK